VTRLARKSRGHREPIRDEMIVEDSPTGVTTVLGVISQANPIAVNISAY